MNEKSTLENLLKSKLESQYFEFKESLWNKLDNELAPVRDAYHKKDRRRVLAYWSFLGLFLLTGASVAYFSLTKNKETANTATQKTNQQENLNKTSQEPIALNKTIVEEKNSTTKQVDLNKATINVFDNSFDDITKKDRNNKSNTKSEYRLESNNRTRSRVSKIKTIENELVEQKVNRNNDVAIEDKIVKENKEEIVVAKQQQKVNESAQIKETIITPDSKANEQQPVEKKEIAKQVSKNQTELVKKKDSNKEFPAEYFVLGGLNYSNTFTKAGYYGGVIVEKQIKEKRIFAGVKVAHNNLDHQLIASSKANVFPQVTDAVINKMTTIQIPFGYEFKLSKKEMNKSTLLNVGFEPTFLTGVQTVYYDDNGVPGGPRTAVVNSPLLSNAINKFNVSFIAGLKIPVTKRMGLLLNGGYGLINITDKQYYNKTSNNNNLKYFQAGLLLKLK